ncbi:MAG: hypothetical protein ACYC2O_07585 [Microthrixaceae bacterium]
MDIDGSARKHGVADVDMLHAVRNHWRAFETDDPAVTMYIGPSSAAEPLEVGVVDDDQGTAVIHAMQARPKFLKGWWKP